VYDTAYLIGMVGIVNISLENRSAEISIIINPTKQGTGYGKRSVDMLLDKGFNELNLENIYGECYENSAHVGFWENYCESK
jgi:RimJ/RimL family protein N-acetyltransferase